MQWGVARDVPGARLSHGVRAWSHATSHATSPTKCSTFLIWQAFRLVNFTVPDASSPPPPPPLRPYASGPPSTPPSYPPHPPFSPPTPMALLGCFQDKDDTPQVARYNGRFVTVSRAATEPAFSTPGFRVGWQGKRAVSKCNERCSGLLGQAFMYMALTDGDLCYCANSYKRVGAALGSCTSDIGFCELEYGCGGKGFLSIYNLSTHYTPGTDALPVSEPNFDGETCPGDTLPVVIDTYIAPVALDTLENGQELVPGCNENTTVMRCSLTSASGQYTMTMESDGVLTVLDRTSGRQTELGGRYRASGEYEEVGPYKLTMGKDNVLTLTGHYTASFQATYYPWALLPRLLWTSAHLYFHYPPGEYLRPDTGTGLAKAVLNDQGGLMVVDGIGKVVFTTGGDLHVGDFDSSATQGSGGPSSGPWPQSTSLLTPGDVVDTRTHSSNLVQRDRDTCVFPGSWRIDRSVAPARSDMQGCHRTFRQQVTSSS